MVSSDQRDCDFPVPAESGGELVAAVDEEVRVLAPAGTALLVRGVVYTEDVELEDAEKTRSGIRCCALPARW